MLFPFDQERRRFVGASSVALAGAGLGCFSFGPPTLLAEESPEHVDLSVLHGATAWLNSPPLSAEALRGKVVVFDVWTFTCINWLRTLPYVRLWEQRYRSHGLVVIGVHSPEFAFEHDVANVRRAAMSMDITYPIAVDNDFAIWRALGNRYWPAQYVIDHRGRLRDRQFGEGKHDRSERAIREALKESGARDFGPSVGAVEGRGIERAADWSHLRSPESYLGYEQAVNFETVAGVARDERRQYTLPTNLRLNHWAVSGDWTVQRQSITLNAPNGRLRFVFHARDLHLVMGPSAPRTTVRFRLLLDGQPPMASHGVDIDAAGNGVITEQRLYQLVRQPGSIVDREMSIEFLDAGAEAFAFTFG